MNVKVAYLIIILALAGLADTGYLYATYVSGGSLVCSILEGCNVVARSPYSQLFGIPLSLWGLAFYAAVFAIGLAFFTPLKAHARRAFYVAADVGLLLSFCFSCIQAFLIGAWCIYCIISALICVLLALVALWMWRSDS